MMGAFPLEIVEFIASFISDDSLAPYATISRTWQAAIERRLFSHLILDNKREDLSDFPRIVWANPARRMFLRYIVFKVFANNRPLPSEAMTSDLRQLFCILAEKNDNKEITLELIFYESSEEDGPRYEHGHPEPRFGSTGAFGERFATVECVSRLVLQVDVYERPALLTAINLMKRLPCLRSITVFGDEMHTYPEDRHGLATALASILSRTECLEVTLGIDTILPREYNTELSWFSPQVTPGSVSLPPYDTLGATVRMWSHNLVYLNISGIFDSSLFWPSKNEKSEITATPWPRLKEFHASLALMTPAGRWYFVENPEIPQVQDDPRDDTLWPLFKAWAKAIESMPVLEQASVTFDVMAYPFSDDCPYIWSVIFLIPDAIPDDSLRLRSEKLDAYSHNSRLIFHDIYYGWRLDDTTIRKLRAVLNNRFPNKKMVELEFTAGFNVREVTTN
ncbi:hypothetical protein F4811DRAFT_509880 [Daldinia bambusicola]|nr:hypothetical protein F4811DRAFT_509880 [Daldinia bambusicola]